MTIQDTLNENNFLDFLNYSRNPVYLKKDMLRIDHYRGFDDYTITDISNALQTGKECVKYTIKNSKHGAIDVSNWIRSKFNCDMKALFNCLDNLYWQQNEYGGYRALTVSGFEVYKSIEKSIRVFSPFNLHYIKPLKSMPKKWTLKHVYKAIVNGQFDDLKCKYNLTDDYAFDNSCNFQKGKINYPMAWIKDIIENPSGWWCSLKKDTDYVTVCCHSFDSNEFRPVINVSSKRREGITSSYKNTRVDNILNKIFA